MRPSISLNRGGEQQAPTRVDVLVPSLNGLRSEFVEHLRSRIPVHCVLTSSVIGPARARQELMERVDTDWFAFVDDDVKLRPDWWSAVTGMVGPDVGGVEGLWSYLAGDKRVDDYTRAMAQLARVLRQESWRGRIDRAFTGDTLVRTEAVKNIRMPNIPVWEDEYIRRWVEKDGFRWLRTPNVVCDHLRTYNLKPSYNVGKYGYYLGRLSARTQLKRVAQLPIKVLFALAYTGNIRAGTFAVEKDLNIFKGVLHAYVNRNSGSPVYSLAQP
ncbi:MAG TPA: glycosyltransferase family A protein [Candidatus Angelobacter sp.]|nr:glycosyltransferase family A protein [Candidatus Angelobacter sp.]